LKNSRWTMVNEESWVRLGRAQRWVGVRLERRSDTYPMHLVCPPSAFADKLKSECTTLVVSLARGCAGHIAASSVRIWLAHLGLTGMGVEGLRYALQICYCSIFISTRASASSQILKSRSGTRPYYNSETYVLLHQRGLTGC
jgi:hypothetical protein